MGNAESTKNIGINSNYIKLIRNIYTNASARMYIDGQTSESFHIGKGVRQGDPISPKLFTAALQEVFRNIDLCETGIMIDGKELTDLRFADDIAFIADNITSLNDQLNRLHHENKKIGLMIHKGKTQYMSNRTEREAIQIDGAIIEKVEEYKYLGQTLSLNDTINKEVQARITAGWRAFGRHKNILLEKEIPMTLKKRVFDSCILPTISYGSETWPLNNNICYKLRTAQRAMERSVTKVKRIDKIRAEDIRARTKFKDVVEHVQKMKWRWAGHVARMNENRWATRCTDWIPRDRKRPAGRPLQRWRDDLVKFKGNNWREGCQDRAKWKKFLEGYLQQWSARPSR